MDIGDIIKEVYSYPISDTNKFFRLALPSLVIGIIFAIMEIMVFITGSENTSNPLYLLAGFLGIVTFLLLIVVSLVNSGIIINIIRNNVNGQHDLPELQIGRFTLDGIKSLIVTFIYMFVPGLILGIISAVFIYIRLEAIAIIFVMLSYVVVFIISLLMPAIYGKLAQTNSMSEALSVSEIWEITKQIGFLKVFGTLLIFIIIAMILLLIAVMIGLMIPVIGPIITTLIYAFYTVATGRCYALLYMDGNNNYTMNNPPNPNSQYQHSNYHQFNNQNNQIQQDASLPGQPIINENNNQLDFQRPNNNQENNTSDFQRPSNDKDNNDKTIRCSKCGAENRSGAKFCMICGEEL